MFRTRFERIFCIVGLGIVAGSGSPLLAQSLVETQAGTMQITPVAIDLNEPWGMDILPLGAISDAAVAEAAILVTERDGRLILIEGRNHRFVTGLPEVFAEGQGGLLDVLVPRDFATSREIWLSYAMPSAGGGGTTAVGRGFLSADGSQLVDFVCLYEGDGYSGGRHFGSRLVEAADGSIFATFGDRGTGPDGLDAQDPKRTAGKVIHINRDGTPATRNAGWRDGVYSLGHRNAQGAALGLDGALYAVEHGAQGGDELNLVRQGANYGWPVISYGQDYGGGKLGEGTAKDGMEQPLHYWDPSIAPSGLIAYSGKLIPEWKGDFLFGSLNSDYLGRLDPDTPAPTGFAEERIMAAETGRIRDVIEAPDGAIWFMSVYDGAIYRLAPEGK